MVCRIEYILFFLSVERCRLISLAKRNCYFPTLISGLENKASDILAYYLKISIQTAFELEYHSFAVESGLVFVYQKAGSGITLGSS